MELIALRTFQAVVEEGGILAASRKLNTVQSNVTGRIRKLEEELGAELFFRKGAVWNSPLRPRAARLRPPHAGAGTADGERRPPGGRKRRRTAHRRHGNLRRPAPASALKAVRAAHPRLELRVFTDTTSS